MSLSGQLGDLSLAELIEFFCNLRKTGRLKVEYPTAPGVFYFKEGELVDAQLGPINGTEAVYHALTLPGAAFDFNTHIYASRRTINEPWMQLVLEGLRRVDENGKPGAHHNSDESSNTDSSTAFHFKEEGKDEPSISEVAADMDDLHRLEDGTWAITSVANPQEPINILPAAAAAAPPEQIAPTAVGAAAGGRRRTVLLGAVGALLICVVAVAGLTNWFGRKTVPANTATTTTAQPDAKTAINQGENSALPIPTGDAATSTESATPTAARVEPQVRPAPEKYNKALNAAPKNPANTANPEATKAAATQASKTVMVQVTVDEAGRVSQASVANSRPGMESYESSALRAARQRRYPAGKSGVITVPVKIN